MSQLWTVPSVSFWRLVLVILLLEAVYAVWLLEQPKGANDMIVLHPRLNWLFNDVLYATGLLYGIWWFAYNTNIHSLPQSVFEVWRNDFWMGHHGAACPKRTSLWCNDWEVVLPLVGTSTKTGIEGDLEVYYIHRYAWLIYSTNMILQPHYNPLEIRCFHFWGNWINQVAPVL